MNFKMFIEGEFTKNVWHMKFEDWEQAFVWLDILEEDSDISVHNVLAYLDAIKDFVKEKYFKYVKNTMDNSNFIKTNRLFYPYVMNSLYHFLPSIRGNFNGTFIPGAVDPHYKELFQNELEQMLGSGETISDLAIAIMQYRKEHGEEVARHVNHIYKRIEFIDKDRKLRRK